MPKTTDKFNLVDMKLYIYDHCPYCVKARMIFGYKNINFKMITLLNDDESTPIGLIGQKMVPILEEEGKKPMPESLDIVAYIDSQDNKPFIKNNTENTDLQIWLQESRDYLYPLAMPRWVKSSLEEFKTDGAKAYFTTKKENYIGPFSEHWEKSAAYIEKANEHLKKLNEMIQGEDFFLNEGASINDIHLFPALRSLSIVKGVQYPEKVFKYMKAQERLSRIPLHIDIAL